MNNLDDLVNSKLQDLEVPGVVMEFEPSEAEHVGAFIEDALTDDEAIESVFDGGSNE